MSRYKRIKTAGVYALICGGTIYIGSSNDVSSRFEDHLGFLRNGTHRNKSLQLAYNFTGEIQLQRLEECYPSECKKLERKWIETYKATHYFVSNKYLPNDKDFP